MAVYLDKLPIRIPAGRGVYVEMKGEGIANAEVVSLKLGMSYRLDSLIDSFWARALHSDVFPVPGGPECGNTQSDKTIPVRTSPLTQADAINNQIYWWIRLP